MGKIKSFIKQILPPIVVSALNRKQTRNYYSGMWTGNYPDWATARSSCSGYDSPDILEKVRVSLLKVKKGEAVYERDSVLFYEKNYSWGLLTGLLQTAIVHDGKLCVLDYGGSLGSSYFQHRDILRCVSEVIWCVVEQPHFVKCGKQYFEDDFLKFFYSMEDCLKVCTPNVLLLSSVLQYLESPFDFIEQLVELQISHIIIDRTPFIDAPSSLITVQHVPETICRSSYPAWFFNEEKFIASFKGYALMGSFVSYCDEDILLDSKYRARWKGFILSLNI